MFQAHYSSATKKMTTEKSPTRSTLSQVNIELRFQSEQCSVSGSPLCFLQATIKASGSHKVSLNRGRPIIEFLEAKDDNAPSGLPLLSFSAADDSTAQPIFSYQLDICYQDDREKQLQTSVDDVKAGDFIVLSEQGYNFTHCMNHSWGYIFTYYQISKLFINRNYRLDVGLQSNVQDRGVWYPKNQTPEVKSVHLELDPSSRNIIRLIE